MNENKKTEAEWLGGVVLASLDEEEDIADLPRKAYRSRTQFFRLFRALIDETPGAMRRRLALERAAWQLGRTRLPVTEIAFDANYGSLEAFTRAFRKAFGVSPSLYRRMGATHYRLPASNGIHFGETSPSKGANNMDLFDIFAGADFWHTRRLLEHARELSPEQLDQPLNNKAKVFPWNTPDQNLQDILERMVQTYEVWTAALLGEDAPVMDGVPAAQRTPAALLSRLEVAETKFGGFLRDVRNRGAWDDTFVDALCEPAETFTFGGMFAHVVTFNAYRRMLALDALRRLGVKIEGFGCPSEYEATLTTAARSR